VTGRRWWLLGTIVAVLVVAAVAVVWGAARPASPQDAAGSYLRALESGDPAAVEATGIDASPTALTAFSAATSLIDGGSVTNTRVDGDAATVDVSFRIDGTSHDARLTLTRTDGRWIVGDSGFGVVTATTTIGDTVAIGDASIGPDATALLPATYPVAAHPTDLLSGEADVTVLPGSAAEAAVEAQLRPAATTAAQTQLDDHLATCTAPGPTPPPGCGIRIPWGTEFRSVDEVRYRIEQHPVVTLTATGFTADGGVLVATVTGTGQDGAPRTTTYRTESWSLRGDVAFTADGLTLTAW
jgi:hypothetical protein